MENPIKMDDLGVPHGTPFFGNTHMFFFKRQKCLDQLPPNHTYHHIPSFLGFVCDFFLRIGIPWDSSPLNAPPFKGVNTFKDHFFQAP